MEFPDINFSNTNHNIFFTKTYFTKTSRNLQLPFFGVFNNKTLCDVCLKWPQDGPSTWTPSLGWKGASNKGPETGKSSWSTQAQQAGPSWGLSWFFHENRHGFSQGKGWHWGYTQPVDFDDVVPTSGGVRIDLPDTRPLGRVKVAKVTAAARVKVIRLTRAMAKVTTPKVIKVGRVHGGGRSEWWHLGFGCLKKIGLKKTPCWKIGMSMTFFSLAVIFLVWFFVWRLRTHDNIWGSKVEIFSPFQ